MEGGEGKLREGWRQGAVRARGMALEGNAGVDLGLGKGGFFFSSKTTPISKPHPLIINTKY